MLWFVLLHSYPLGHPRDVCNPFHGLWVTWGHLKLCFIWKTLLKSRKPLFCYHFMLIPRDARKSMMFDRIWPHKRHVAAPLVSVRTYRRRGNQEPCECAKVTTRMEIGTRYQASRKTKCMTELSQLTSPSDSHPLSIPIPSSWATCLLSLYVFLLFFFSSLHRLTPSSRNITIVSRDPFHPS